MKRRLLFLIRVLALVALSFGQTAVLAAPVPPAPSAPLPTPRFHAPTGPVRVVGHSFADDNGPFLGLGVSYFTALWRCKHDRQRLELDLAFRTPPS